MNAVSVQTAGERLDALIDEVVASGEPVLITGMESKAVLISEEVWRGIQATLDLVSIPGMRTSILDGMGTALHELSSEPLW
jgi:antitoxin YefM